MIETAEVRRKYPSLVKCSRHRQKLRRHRTLAALAAVAFVVLVSASCGEEDDCDVEAQSRRLGGAGLQDCGIAHGDDQGVVDRCVLGAHQKNETYRALYELDDGRLQAFVHAAGDIYLLLREAEGGGVERADCEDGVVVREGGRTYVECDQPSAFEQICK